MPYQVRTEQRPNTSKLDSTIVVLANPDVSAVAEIWPALGFNCFRWQAGHKDQLLDLLYADPQVFAGGKPTRTGIPILFPFPNRIRGGRFSWDGKEYPLPITDASGPNAIHGFPCRRPWRAVDQGTNAESAWVTGEFHGSVDDPKSSAHWPADYIVRITYRLLERGLRLEAQVTNPSRGALPFGLGFHPYFRVPFVLGTTEQDYVIQCAAKAYWALEGNLPTGIRLPLEGGRDLTAGRPLAELKLDDVLTDLSPPPTPPGEGGAGGGRASAPRGLGAPLLQRGSIRATRTGVEVQLWTTPAFRELVVFTPPHRQAFCLEPYTCTTDAINLQQQGIDAGLLVLEPGAQWQGVVEVRVE